ncbi:hypothetical protein [Methylopila turkensis]|uniref:Uncharacterized protein n=1 Tax=Methylopila turkensis TaxID=1437816 RepID=A0A9W6JKH2_9HYPH|nr:hypothetical protein [Methylopila turkensis]GLK79320.1 hypothetical protein GCM10008174_10610 [Methylopila turkensis]
MGDNLPKDNYSINDFVEGYLGIDLMAAHARDERLRQVKSAFHFCLDGNEDSDFLYALYRLTDLPPWTYWDERIISHAISFIDQHKLEFFSSVRSESRALDSIIRNIWDRNWLENEKSHALDKADDLSSLKNGLLPKYIHLSEHIYSNILRLFCRISGKKNFAGTRNEIARLRRIFSENIDRGYDDRVRNAIAHGEVSFRADRIVLGADAHPYEISTYDFEKKFDDLFQNSISLVAAILVCFSKNYAKKLDLLEIFPPSMIAFLLDGCRAHNGIEYQGALERYSDKGKELDVYLKGPRLGHSELLFEVAKIALTASEFSGRRFNWMQLAVDTGVGTPSLAIVNVAKISDAAHNNLPFSAFEGAIPTALFWRPIPVFIARVYLMLSIIKIEISKRKRAPRCRAYVKHVENVSIGNKVRVRVTASLTKDSVNYDTKEIQKILMDLMREYEKKFFWTLRGKFEPGIPLFRRPSYVWINLYGTDAPLRKIGGGGWTGQNLIAAAEFKRWFWQRPILPHKRDYTKGPFSMILKKPDMFDPEIVTGNKA